MLLEFLETANGARILKLATIHGFKFVAISAGSTINHGAVLHGEPTSTDNKTTRTIDIGKAVFIDSKAQIYPPKSGLKIGLYTMVGPSLVVKSAYVGLRVLIEANCQLGVNLVVNEGCIIRENTVIPDKMVIPSFTEVKGQPGVNWQCTPLAPGYKKAIEQQALMRQLVG